jgi:hypothetical protein
MFDVRDRENDKDNLALDIASSGGGAKLNRSRGCYLNLVGVVVLFVCNEYNFSY